MDSVKKYEDELEVEERDEVEDAAPESLEDFLLEHPVDNDTTEIILSERLKKFNFRIGTMSADERKSYLKACTIKKGGKVMDVDDVRFSEMVVTNHCLYPDFRSMEFISKCGKKTPREALYKVLKTGEVTALAGEIMRFNGYDQDFEELRKQAKN